MRNASGHFSIRRLCAIIGPWRIVWLILAAAMASVYLGPSVALFAGYVDSCAWGGPVRRSGIHCPVGLYVFLLYLGCSVSVVFPPGYHTIVFPLQQRRHAENCQDSICFLCIPDKDGRLLQSRKRVRADRHLSRSDFHVHFILGARIFRLYELARSE